MDPMDKYLVIAKYLSMDKYLAITKYLSIGSIFFFYRTKYLSDVSIGSIFFISVSFFISVYTPAHLCNIRFSPLYQYKIRFIHPILH